MYHACAFAFQTDLSYRDMATLLGARDDWLGQPDLDGRWVQRDNDTWGNYLSWYARTGSQLTKLKILFGETCNHLNVVLESEESDVAQAWQALQVYALNELLPSLRAHGVQRGEDAVE